MVVVSIENFDDYRRYSVYILLNILHIVTTYYDSYILYVARAHARVGG